MIVWQARGLVASVANALLMSVTLLMLWLLAVGDGPHAVLQAAYRPTGGTPVKIEPAAAAAAR